MLAVLPVFRCCFSCLLFLFTVFWVKSPLIGYLFFALVPPLLHYIILSDSLPAVLQDVMIYSAEVRGRFGYGQ